MWAATLLDYFLVCFLWANAYLDWSEDIVVCVEPVATYVSWFEGTATCVKAATAYVEAATACVEAE